MSVAGLVALDRIEDAIARIEGIPAASGSAEVSFGFGPLDWLNTNELTKRLETLMNALARALTNQPGIETAGRGRIVARTAAGYAGDMSTVGLDGLLDSEIAAHLAQLSATLELRAKLARVFVAASRTAVALSLTAATPLGAVSAATSLFRLISELEGVISASGQPRTE